MQLIPRKLLAGSVGFVMATAGGEPLPGKYANSVLSIHGDTARGTGFVTRFKGRPVIATSQHLVLGQKNLRISNANGTRFKATGGVIAASVDIAMLSITGPLPAGITPFEPGPDPGAAVKPGDEVLIPGNSLGNGKITTIPGTITSVEPDRIGHDAPTLVGNSGSPVYHVASGRVIGIDTATVKSALAANWPVPPSDSPAPPPETPGGDGNAAGNKLVAHRFDTEKEWLALDWRAAAATGGQITKLCQQIQDSFTFLDSGKYSEIRDDVMRDQFTRIEEMAKRKNMSEVDFHSSFVRAIDSSRNSLDFKTKGLAKQAMGFHHRKEFKAIEGASTKIRAAFDVMKGDPGTARSIYAGGYVVPPKIKEQLYPDGGFLIAE